MMNTRFAHLLCVGALSLLLIAACKQYDDCPTDVAVLEEFVNDGQEIAIYADGKAYTKKRGLCSDPITYFDPSFVAQNYFFDSSGVYIRTEDGALFPTRNRYQDDFEGYANLLDVFARSVQDTGKFWVGFTAQSPDHPEIADYVALRQCILGGTCAFADNKLELISDPTNAANHCLKMHAVKPSRKMVTSKMSIESPLPYFVKGMDLWFQADFYLNGSTFPYSLVDFENPYFEQSPGPRIVFDGQALAWENKFGAKDKTSQTAPVIVPTNRWFTLKVHIFFTNTADGLLEIWQDGLQVLRANGKTLPTANSIQSSLEVGISATSDENEIYLDNVRLSDVAF
jgi:Polysaccharide lyase